MVDPVALQHGPGEQRPRDILHQDAVQLLSPDSGVLVQPEQDFEVRLGQILVVRG
jgi:hypothetical protein